MEHKRDRKKKKKKRGTEARIKRDLLRTILPRGTQAPQFLPHYFISELLSPSFLMRHPTLYEVFFEAPAKVESMFEKGSRNRENDEEKIT